MAEIRTTRMRLVQWTEGTDSPQRVDFNETFGNIENLAAIDQQGTYGNLPTPNKTGMYYFASDQGILYRSDGLAWAVVGASTLSHLVKAARADSVSLTVQAITGQTADLQRITAANGTTYVRVRSNGDLLVGPLRVSQSSRTTTASDAAPTDSAITVDNASASMWAHTAKNTTGNTSGYYRAVRGTSTVFSVGPDGSIRTPSVTVTSAPSSDDHAVRRTDLTTAVSGAIYDINGENLSGTLSVVRGGTGRTTLSSGQYLVGAGTNGITSKTPTQVRSDIGAATYDHGHALTDANITGVLPVAQGGTGATSAEDARSALSVPVDSTTITAGAGLSGGGSLAANRTLQVVFEGSGSASTVARSDHKHQFSELGGKATLAQMPDTSLIPANADLNTYTANGKYIAYYSRDALTTLNYPVKESGLLTVAVDDGTLGAPGGPGRVFQTYTTYHPDRSVTFIRTRYDGTWGAWRKSLEQSDLDPQFSTISLPSGRAWAGHGFVPQLIREGKRRSLRGRVARTPVGQAQFEPGVADGTLLFHLPVADLPSTTVGGTGQVASFVNPGYARIELLNLDNYPATAVIGAVSRSTSWIGLDGIYWYID